MMVPGSVIEPGTVKLFKSRLKDGHIVHVPEQDFDKWNEYFKVRFGTPILVPEKEPEKESEKEPEPEKVAKIVKPTAAVVVKAH